MVSQHNAADWDKRNMFCVQNTAVCGYCEIQGTECPLEREDREYIQINPEHFYCINRKMCHWSLGHSIHYVVTPGIQLLIWFRWVKEYHTIFFDARVEADLRWVGNLWENIFLKKKENPFIKHQTCASCCSDKFPTWKQNQIKSNSNQKDKHKEKTKENHKSRKFIFMSLKVF